MSSVSQNSRKVKHTVSRSRPGSHSANPNFAVVEGPRMPQKDVLRSRPAATRHSDSGTSDWKNQDGIGSGIHTVSRNNDDLLMWE